MHIHATVWEHTYMRSLSVELMDASSVELSSVRMMDTSAVSVTATLCLIPYSHLSFNLEENGFMKILRASRRLKVISTVFV